MLGLMSRLDRLESMLNLELDGARETGDCGTSVALTLSRNGGVRAGTADGRSILRLCLAELAPSLSEGGSESAVW